MSNCDYFLNEVKNQLTFRSKIENMKQLISLLLAILAILILTLFSCSRNAQKFLDKGDYHKAYNIALKNLKKDRKSRKDRSVLNKSFEQILNDKNSEYDRYIKSDVIEDWEIAYNQYKVLWEIYDEGKSYLDNSYDSELLQKKAGQEVLMKDIANNYFRMGTESMATYKGTDNKAYAQDAYTFFRKADSYEVNEVTAPDLDRFMDESLTAGMISILVITEAPYDRILKREIDKEFYELESKSEGFEEILYERNIVNPDCVLRMYFDRLDVDVDQDRSRETFTEEIEDGYDTSQDTSGVEIRTPRYRTVTGQVTTIRDRVIYSWQMEVNPEGPSDICHFDRKVFREREEITNEYYEISGDNRAIPNRYNQPYFDSRNEEDVIADLIEELYDEVIRNYFD